MTTARPRRKLPAVLFVAYLAILTWVILWKLGLPHLGSGDPSVKLTPYVTDGWHGASQPSEVVANVLLFAPFGVYTRLLTRRIALPLLGAAGLSTAFETAQFALRIGRTDITDVMANTAGATVGMAIATLALTVLGAQWGRRLLTGVGSMGTAAAVALSTVLVAR